MAFTSVTSQALVETTREKMLIASRSIELYIQTNSAGLLAGVITDLAAVTASITAVSA